jgi:hypothetical protein
MWQMVLVLLLSCLSVGLDGKELRFLPGLSTVALEGEQVPIATYKLGCLLMMGYK